MKTKFNTPNRNSASKRQRRERIKNTNQVRHTAVLVSSSNPETIRRIFNQKSLDDNG